MLIPNCCFPAKWESKVPNDRVRAFSLWKGWQGYDRAKYAAMLREAFEPFVHACSSAE